MAGDGEGDAFSVSMLRPYETRLKAGGLSVGGLTMGGPISWMESIAGEWTEVEDTMMARLVASMKSRSISRSILYQCRYRV